MVNATKSGSQIAVQCQFAMYVQYALCSLCFLHQEEIRVSMSAKYLR